MYVIHAVGVFISIFLSTNSASSQSGGGWLFLPSIVAGFPADLSISHWETTQAVQTATNSVPQVAQRPTLIRLYASSGTQNPINEVTVDLAASRDGIVLPGSPIQVSPVTISGLATRDVYSSTVNISLPVEWASGTVVYTATIDAGNVVPEANENNNKVFWTTTYISVPPLKLVILPLRHIESTSGAVHTIGPTHSISPYLMRMFPFSTIDITQHPQVDFFGDLTQPTDWARLINVIVALKRSENAPQTAVYLGVLPASSPVIYGGYSISGDRISLVVENSGLTEVHEIGHTFGRTHADCGGAQRADPDYPYPGGLIGQYGVDLVDKRVFGPDMAHDVMSYCMDWISDYTYIGIMNDQLQRVSSASTESKAAVLGSSSVPEPTLVFNGLQSVFDIYGSPELEFPGP